VTKKDLLVEYVVQDLVQFLASDESIGIKHALLRVYSSSVFEKLQDADTGLYLEGSAYVYDLLCNELRNGWLIQEEV